MNEKIYDLIIVGTGFAGYSAGIYASRYKMSNLIFGDVFGGQTAEAHIIGNYPGFEEITGPELMQKVQTQAKKLGTEEIFERITHIEESPEQKTVTVTTVSGKQFTSKYVLLTVGMKRKKLGIKGEPELAGHGISYCATCDGFFFRNKKVVVIGGGDSATTAALFLANMASEVTLIARGDRLKGETIWIDQIKTNPKITVMLNTTVTSFEGTALLNKVIVQDKSGTTTEIEAEGAFVEIGSEPDKVFLESLGLQTAENSRVLVDKTQKTSKDRIYAAGDVTNASNEFEQLLTAGGEAAVAVNAIFEKMQSEA